ncbi:MAG: hypothetical protein ACNS62_15555, partial [Candidatus Cyclobacteriaceae bacterium M3_2C_046]
SKSTLNHYLQQNGINYLGVLSIKLMKFITREFNSIIAVVQPLEVVAQLSQPYPKDAKGLCNPLDILFNGVQQHHKTGAWKLIYYHADQSFELFHLGEDLGEQHNLTANILRRLRKWPGV